VTIGALEGSEGERLFQVAAAARLDDGRIVVANSGTHEIRYFDPAGKHLFSIGRRGEGPGEFRQITNLLRYPGGTLMVYDAILRRGTLLDPDGRVTRLVDFARSGPARPFGPVGRLTDGSIVVLFGSTRSYSGASGVVRDTLELGRFADDGTFLGIVGRVPGGEAFVVAGVGPFRLPFGHPGPTVAVRDSVILTRRGEGFEMGVLSPQGEWIAVLKKAHDPQRITRTHVDRYQEEWLARAGTDEPSRSTMRRILASIPYPNTFPAISNLIVDREDDLWVEHYPAGSDPTPNTWSIFAPDGRWLGDITMPPGLEILEIGRDYVLGVWRDEQGIEYIRQHRLEGSVK
jgi:hypothetical protein